MKLFTIGDSVSQGFMSLGAANTHRSYSTLIAEKLKINNYQYPSWEYQMPANIEDLLRKIEVSFGPDINGVEWPFAINTARKFIDQIEDYYERGPGHEDKKTEGSAPYHNVAIQGFKIADAWQVTPKLCRHIIKNPKDPKQANDNIFRFPHNSFSRIALKVLNPKLDPKYENFSQIGWLQYHAEKEGVENLFLWLGANNALRTIARLNINMTQPGSDPSPMSLSYQEREEKCWNLWHPEHFEEEYRELLTRVNKAMNKNKHKDWKVFIGTIPHITIAPIIKGVGPKTIINTKDGPRVYFKYYTYVPYEEEYVRSGGPHLTIHQALHIDNVITKYNEIIDALIKEQNCKVHNRDAFHLVDISKALSKIAWKRNDGNPTYDFPDYFKFKYPQVNTKFYHADRNGRLKQGGLVSLDGVHPSIIGQGLIAYEFLKVMKANNRASDTDLDWDMIFKNDRLYSEPITIMTDLYQLAQTVKKFVGPILDRYDCENPHESFLNNLVSLPLDQWDGYLERIFGRNYPFKR
ncbi:MAG: hypothetical protein AAF490_15470 [Chloroflexota bacterium]